ncbi:MAG: YjjG family noncanonical pyrimidine nucleotidase [Clostridia bacterium]|nr:YjjG family noncanonical pyrimidine nucleotidase [Clostridia bacterium]
MIYSTLYFDLDNTLLDFFAAERNAIRKLLVAFGIEPQEEYVALYSEINIKTWTKFERGEIKREEIFESRFVEFTDTIGVKADTARMSNDYFALLAEGHDCLPGAKEVLEYVKRKGYTVCVTTNGISKTQHKRIAESGLGAYFDFVFISEDTGHKKPEKEYFDYVKAHTPEKNPGKILIIGDSQSSDILGGINAGIDTCWLNPSGEPAAYPPTYEIRNISEIKRIL